MLIFTTTENIPALSAFRDAGCEVFGTETQEDGNLSIHAILRELGHCKMTNVLVEGGRGVLGKFFDAKVVDEVWAYHCRPKLFGGEGAFGPVGGQGIGQVGESIPVQNWEVETIGDDVLLNGRVSALSREVCVTQSAHVSPTSQ